MKLISKHITHSALFTPVYAFIGICIAGLLFDDNNVKVESGYDKPEGYAEFFKQITTPIGQEQSSYAVNYRLKEFRKAKTNARYAKAGTRTWEWEHRGPGNVGGRTRDVIIDPDDATHRTWFAASASGGVWTTTDAGETWQNLTPELVNLASNTIAMAPSNTDVLYIGTGEGYGGFGMVSGNGVFRSDDRGINWTQLDTTASDEDFRWVNKIVIDIHNEDIVLAATNTGIFKSLDGGATWDTGSYKGYAVQDLAVNPNNPNTLYAGVNSLGIIKSYDFGDSWIPAYEGIGTGYRFSVSVSPADTNHIFACAEAPGLRTDVYISDDGAESWSKSYDSDNSFIHFLGQQGWFNNIIEAHPFNANKLFIGGVYLGSIEFSNTINYSTPQVMRVDTFGTGGYMNFVNFGGYYFRGSVSTGLDEGAEVEEDDYVSVEVRFGSECVSKAHRFIVPEGQGSGVPAHEYQYQDYVDVPFEVWDTDNDEQLMISFRDQDRNGEFNLTEREWDDDISGREYIFIHKYPYAEVPEADIAQEGGTFEKMLYFLWPTLPEDSTWNPDALPNSIISIQYGCFTLKNAETSVLSDDNRNSNLHVDHHDLEIAITDTSSEEFMVLDANDGGLGISYDQGENWEQIKNGYHTTQFYGVAKKPGAHEYIGGMQDNGTWQSPINESAGPTSEYSDRVAGDGFEALWHPDYPSRILASSYYNQIELSIDGGKNWSIVNDGISGGGPFITRLSNSLENPNLVFAVGNYGVYRHSNFCVGRYPWRLTAIDSGWALNNIVTSSHNVEVSLASPSVVWAGGGMNEDPDLNIFVSTDYGETFNTVNLFDEQKMGYITAIATHPTDSATAYILFSLAEKPKVIRTTDLGQTWEDITGFGDSTSSSKGFPDVMTYSLLVMPDETNTIWVGTEIGIFESTDNGASWNSANNNFPAVAVWQMYIQDHTIVVATHGRGIWSTTQWPASVEDSQFENDMELSVYPNPSNGIFNISINSDKASEFTIDILSMSGSKLYSTADVLSGGEYNSQINVSHLPGGTYILAIHTNNTTEVRKIVIQ